MPEALSLATPSQVKGFKSKPKEYTHENSSLKYHLSQHELTSFALDSLPVSTLIFDQNLRIITCNPHFIAELKLTSSEHELKESHQQMMRAVNATEDGIWEWNVQTNEVNYSPKLLDMIGHGDEQEAKFEMWLEHIHPKYIDKVNKALDTHFKKKEQYKVEYLGKDKNDNYSWFLAIGNSVFDDEGNPTVMSGTLRDIETEKQLRLEIAEKENILNAIYNGTQQAIWLVKAVQDDFVFLEFNQTACERAGLKYREIIGKPLTSLNSGIFTPENTANIKLRLLS